MEPSLLTLVGSVSVATIAATVSLAVAYINRNKASRDDLKAAEKNFELTKREADSVLHKAQLDFQTEILNQIRQLNKEINTINKELAACELSKAELKTELYKKIQNLEHQIFQLSNPAAPGKPIDVAVTVSQTG